VAFPTDEDFEYQRRVIRETYPRLFDAVEDQLRYVDEYLGGLIPPEPTKFDLALVAHLARASKTALGIVRNCEHGFGEIAMMSLRGLGETMVSAYWMSLDPDTRAEQFEKFTRLEVLNILDFVEAMGWTDEIEVPDELRDEERIEEVRREFPNPVQGWMQEPMNRVLDDIEPCWPGDHGRDEFRRVARLLHLFGDRHSHVGAFDTLQYLSAPEEGMIAIQLGPGKKWVPQALIVAAWVYGQIFDLAAEHFGIPDLESWRRRWQLLLARCRTVSPDEARDVGRNDPCPCGSGFKFKRCHLEIVGQPEAAANQPSN
jgi:hypothetical protein